MATARKAPGKKPAHPSAPKTSGSSAEIRDDSWQNLFASIGAKTDRRSNTTFGASEVLPQEVLSDLYQNGAFSRKVVDLPADEMTREWLNIEGDKNDAINKAMKRLKCKQVFRSALKWASLYGGSLVVMGIDDGGLLNTPLTPNRIRSLKFLKVYDRHQVSFSVTDLNNDKESEFFGEPEYYTVNSYTNGVSFRVHRSRAILFDGVDLPEQRRQANQGWGDSVLQSVYEELRDYGLVRSNGANITTDFVQTMLQIEGLTDLLSTDEGYETVKRRLNLIDLSRSINNTILLDAQEQFSKQASSIGGFPELVQEYRIALCGATGFPMTKLFGQSAAGLNATGDNDVRNFYDRLKSEQDDRLRPACERVAEIIMLSKDSPYRGVVDENVKIEFNPLWQMDDEQEAKWKKTIAETDAIYINASVLSPENVARDRFGNGFNPDTVLDDTLANFEDESDENGDKPPVS